MRASHDFPISENSTSFWREALAAVNPMELWQAWQEAEDAVCLMAPIPLRHDQRRD